jgi:hypothetical protein
MKNYVFLAIIASIAIIFTTKSESKPRIGVYDSRCIAIMQFQSD